MRRLCLSLSDSVNCPHDSQKSSSVHDSGNTAELHAQFQIDFLKI